jgi:hypothetical protein
MDWMWNWPSIGLRHRIRRWRREAWTTTREPEEAFYNRGKEILTVHFAYRLDNTCPLEEKYFFLLHSRFGRCKNTGPYNIENYLTSFFWLTFLITSLFIFIYWKNPWKCPSNLDQLIATCKENKTYIWVPIIATSLMSLTNENFPPTSLCWSNFLNGPNICPSSTLLQTFVANLVLQINKWHHPRVHLNYMALLILSLVYN